MFTVILICATVIFVVVKVISFANDVLEAWVDTKDGSSEQQQELKAIRDQLNGLEDRHAELSQKFRQAIGK